MKENLPLIDVSTETRRHIIVAALKSHHDELFGQGWKEDRCERKVQ